MRKLTHTPLGGVLLVGAAVKGVAGVRTTMPKSLIAVTRLRVVLGLAFLPPLSNDEMPDRSIKQHGRDEALYGSSQVKTGRYENARRQQKRATMSGRTLVWMLLTATSVIPAA
jgi:hypothetical protein